MNATDDRRGGVGGPIAALVRLGSRRTKILILAVMAIAPLATASPAWAIDYYAAPAPTGTVTGSCPSSQPCTIHQALAVAGGRGDRILLAPGLYTQGEDAVPRDTYRNVHISGAAHDGLTIQGAGSGTDPANSTIFRPANRGVEFLSTTAFTILSSDVTLTSVRIDTSFLNNPNFGGVLVFAPNATLGDIALNHAPSAGANSNPAISVFASGATVGHVSVFGSLDTALIRVGQGGGLTLLDSTADANGTPPNGAALGIEGSSTAIVQRSDLTERTSSVPAVLVKDTSLNDQPAGSFDSTIIHGGSDSIRTVQTFAFSAVNLAVRNSVLDANAEYTADDPTTYYSLHAMATNSQSEALSASIDSSVLREPVQGDPGGLGAAETVTCTYSDVPGDTSGGGGSSLCNPASNQNRFHPDPSQLFANVADFSTASIYTPLAGGPLVDAGNPAALAPYESATDRGGNPRVVALTCGGGRDIGARELQGAPPANCPVVPGGGGAGGGGVASGGGGGGGGAGGGSGGGQGLAAAPILRDVSMTRTRFAVAPSATPIEARRKAARGSAFRYALSAAASIRIDISALLPGRRAGRRCVAQSKRNNKKPRCMRSVLKGTLSRRGSSGQNTVPFSGRIGSRALRPGRYQAAVVATNDGGKSSRSTVSFTIVRA